MEVNNNSTWIFDQILSTFTDTFSWLSLSIEGDWMHMLFQTLLIFIIYGYTGIGFSNIYLNLASIKWDMTHISYQSNILLVSSIIGIWPLTSFYASLSFFFFSLLSGQLIIIKAQTQAPPSFVKTENSSLPHLWAFPQSHPLTTIKAPPTISALFQPVQIC